MALALHQESGYQDFYCEGYHVWDDDNSHDCPEDCTWRRDVGCFVRTVSRRYFQVAGLVLMEEMMKNDGNDHPSDIIKRSLIKIGDYAPSAKLRMILSQSEQFCYFVLCERKDLTQNPVYRFLFRFFTLNKDELFCPAYEKYFRNQLKKPGKRGHEISRNLLISFTRLYERLAAMTEEGIGKHIEWIGAVRNREEFDKAKKEGEPTTVSVDQKGWLVLGDIELVDQGDQSDDSSDDGCDYDSPEEVEQEEEEEEVADDSGDTVG